MLICDDTNKLDAIDTALSVSALFGDLLSQRALDRDITLTDRAANGLGYVLTLLSDTLGEAAIALHQARDEVQSAEAISSARIDAEAEYRRGRAVGFVLGSADPFPVLGTDERSMCREWARIGVTLAGITICENLDGDQKRKIDQDVKDFVDGFFAEKERSERHGPGNEAKASPSPAPVPKLTEGGVMDGAEESPEHETSQPLQAAG